MKEQFDKRLAKKIKDSFENYQEPYDPKAWDKLSAAYFIPKKGLSDKPWLLRAAAVSVIMGAAFLFYWLMPISRENLQVADNPTELAVPNSSPKHQLAPEFAEAATGIPKKDAKKPSPGKTDGMLVVNPVSTPILEDEKEEMVSEQLNYLTEGVTLNSETASKKEIETRLVPEKEMITNNLITSNTTALVMMDDKEAKAAISEWLGEANPAFDEKSKETDHPIKLGMMLIPQAVNNSNQSLNLGAGLISEIPLGKKLKIDLGMAYVSQNLDPGNNLNNFLMENSDIASAFRASSISNNVINSSSELRFGQLEVPINLKYQVMDGKNAGLYVLTGVSNMFLLNQRNVNTVNTANMSAMFGPQQDLVQTFSQTIRPDNLSGSETIGQMINFGFGYEYGLSNGTFISVEPFYKTSLGRQTFLGQQMSIGGLNLRMNFQLKK